MMLGCVNFSQLTSGSKSSQPESPVTCPFSSLSIVKVIARSEYSHRVSIVAANCWFSIRPSTKGAAIASSAQAARAGRLD